MEIMKEKERGDNNKKEDMKGKRQVHSGEKKSEVKKKKINTLMSLQICKNVLRFLWDDIGYLLSENVETISHHRCYRHTKMTSCFSLVVGLI